MKDAITVLENRRSCRDFDGRQVDDKTLDMILKAGTFAPTGMGRQSPVMVAVKDKQTIKQLSEMKAKSKRKKKRVC